MVFIYTDEMIALKNIFEPYEVGCHLVDDAPKEAVNAKEKFRELIRKQTEDEINSWFE